MLRLFTLCLLHKALAVRVVHLNDIQDVIRSRPSICADEIVHETGRLIDADDEVTICGFEELRGLLSASAVSMAQLWKALDLPMGENFVKLPSAPCADVCHAVARVLKAQDALPPSSDTGCTIVNGEQVCDIDLTPQGVSGLVNYKPLPDFHDKEIIDEAQTLEETRLVAEAAEDPVTKPAAQGPLAPAFVDYDRWSLLRKVANLFRIYPASGASAAEVASDSSLLEKGIRSDPDWQTAALKKNEQARAVLMKAIRLFRARETNNELNMWFGKHASTNDEVRQEMLRILNSVDSMLDKVHYVYPGSTCKPETYAYVYPKLGDCDTTDPQPGQKCTKDKDGKFLFYLCDHYMQKVDEQIETLLHEGSHHAIAFTDDECVDEFSMGANVSVYQTLPLSSLTLQEIGATVWIPTPSGYPEGHFTTVGDEAMANVERIDGETAVVKMYIKGTRYICETKAYGRSTCKTLAKLSPKLALKNADNFCYFVSDIGASESKQNKPAEDECIQTGDFCVGDHVTFKGRDFLSPYGQKIESGVKGVVIFPGFKDVQAPYEVGDKVEIGHGSSWLKATVTSTKPLQTQFSEGGKSFQYDRIRPVGGQEHVFVLFDGAISATFVNNGDLEKFI